MTGHGAKFERKRDAAIDALISQKSVEDAARIAGISASTLSRWMKLPEFEAAYREARRASLSHANARLQQATGAAAMTVLKLMVDASAPPAVRLRAAECVLDRAAEALETEDLEVRVTALERAAKER
jgi:transposase-like protein